MGHHRNKHKGYERFIVENAHKPRACEPESPKPRIEETECGSAPLHRHDRRHSGFQNRLLRTHADAPEQHAHNGHRRRVCQEHKRREEERDSRRDDDCRHPPLVVHLTEEKCGHRVDAHRRGVEQGHHIVGKEFCLGHVEAHERKICKAESQKTNSHKIVPVSGIETIVCSRRSLPFKLMGIGILAPRDKQYNEGDSCRNQEKSESERISGQVVAAFLQREHKEEHKRPGECTNLIEHLLERKALAGSDLRGGKGGDGGLCRSPYRFAEALQHDEPACIDPAEARRQRQRRNRDQVDRVADDRNQPVPLCLVADIPGDQAKGIADELAEARDEPHRRGRGPEQEEVRTQDAPRTLVGQV